MKFRRVFRRAGRPSPPWARLGLSAAVGAIALYRALGPATLDLIHENPYLLCGRARVYLPL